METLVPPADIPVTTMQPIEEKFVFANYTDCANKLEQLKTQHKNVNGLRCVPDGSSN